MGCEIRRAGTKEKYPPASQKKNSAKWVKRKKSANESKEKNPPMSQKKNIRQWVKRKISASGSKEKYPPSTRF
jgi:hypothetical protein